MAAIGERAAIEFQHRRDVIAAATGAGFVGAAVHGQPQREAVQLALGHLSAQHRIGNARAVAAELLFGQLRQRLGAPEIATADRTQRLPLVLQQLLGDGPAFAELAEQILLRHPHLIEKCLTERGGAADQANRRHRNPRRLHVDQQKTDALVLGRLGVGAHQAEHPVRLVGVRSPQFVTIHHEVIAINQGTGSETREIGARARLAVTLAPHHLIAGDAREMPQFLFRSAALEQHRPQQRQPRADRRRSHANAAELLGQHAGLIIIQPGAAVFLRPGGRQPATFGTQAVPALLGAPDGCGRDGIWPHAVPDVQRAQHGGIALIQPASDVRAKVIQ